jgi:ABC-type bacteriocin/lantibiotic exporter with double-glycine peptidase domain
MALANWESTCRITKVTQEDPFGCGVACLAMVAKTDYASARLTFLSYGFGSEHRRNGKAPFASNFAELILVLGEHGIDARMQRWKGWDQFDGIGIIKVKCGPGARKNDWHWVVAEKHAQFDVVIHDPDYFLPCFREHSPEDVQCHPFDSYEPHGNWISLRRF